MWNVCNSQKILKQAKKCLRGQNIKICLKEIVIGCKEDARQEGGGKKGGGRGRFSCWKRRRMRTRKGSWSLASAMPTTTRRPRHGQAGANSPPWPRGGCYAGRWSGMACLKTWLLGVGTDKHAWQPRWQSSPGWRSSPFQYQMPGSPTFIKSTYLFISQWAVSSASVVYSCAHCRKFNILVVPSSLHPNLNFFLF